MKMKRAARRQTLRSSAVFMALLTASCTQVASSPDAELWIRNVHVVDPHTGAVARDQAIGISRDTIVAIIPHSDVTVSSASRTVDGAEVDTDACRNGLRRAAGAGLAITPTLVVTFMSFADATTLAAQMSGADREEGCETYLRDFSGLSAEQQAVLPAAGAVV